MRQLRVIPFSLSVVMLIASCVHAIGVSALDLDSLVNDSGLIVVGEVILVHDVGATRVNVFSEEYPARVLSGVLHVDQVLKGTVSSDTVSFRFYVPKTFVGWQSVTPNTYATFFFKPGVNANWSLQTLITHQLRQCLARQETEPRRLTA